MTVISKQWMQAKKPVDITLDGVDVELDWDGSSINSATIRDANGNSLRIIKGEYGGMRAMVPATVEKHRLHGTCLGIDIDQTFDEKHDAESRKTELTDVSDNADLSIEKVRVPA